MVARTNKVSSQRTVKGIVTMRNIAGEWTLAMKTIMKYSTFAIE